MSFNWAVGNADADAFSLDKPFRRTQINLIILCSLQYPTRLIEAACSLFSPFFSAFLTFKIEVKG